MDMQKYWDHVNRAEGAGSRATQLPGDGPVPSEERLAYAGAAQAYSTLALAEALRAATEAFINK